MDSSFANQLVEALPLPAFFVDADHRLAGINADASKILVTTLLERNYLMSVRHPALQSAIETCFRDGNKRSLRLTVNVQSLEMVYGVTVALVGNSGVLVTFMDQSSAEEIGQMRRDFVANVSHELKTPLTALLGFIETLRGPARNDDKVRDRFLEIMEREASRMNRLVRDLLSLSRVEAEERIPPAEHVDVAHLLNSVCNSLQPVADNKGTKIRLDVGADVAVTGDRDQLMQVFSNLIENAVKYGGDGDVEVQVTVLPRDPAVRGAAVMIAVKDHGPGIDPIHIPRLTERFYRIDSHRSREMGGTGLGLAIVKHIVNRHRGRLRIESVPGQGSTFSIILPSA